VRFASFARKCAQKANLLYERLARAAMPDLSENIILPNSYMVSGRKLPLKCVVSNRARRLTLRLEQGGRGLRVAAPPRSDNAAILNFIRRHEDWLEKQLAACASVYTEGGDDALKAGGFIPIFGEPHRIVQGEGRGVTELRGQGGEKQIVVYGAPEFLTRHIRDFLKKQAEKTLAPLVDNHAATVGIKPASISYKDTKSRWGSCSSERRLAFSWRIVMAPMGVANYLAAHEVAHLAEMNHSPRFWALCERLCPETRKWRAWLKENGRKLHAIPLD